MERLAAKVKRLERNYKYSARKYNYYNLLITIPSIGITSLSSIFSFLSSSEYLSTDVKNYCVISVAMLTTISAMLQTISSSCEFSVKKLKFTEAAQQFNHVSDRVFFERKFPNEENFIDDVEKEIEKIKSQCKFIPLEIKHKKEEEHSYGEGRCSYYVPIESSDISYGSIDRRNSGDVTTI